MKLCDINPYLRYAAQAIYKSENNPVKVTDCRIFYITDGGADIFIENKHYPLRTNSFFYCCGGSEYNIVSPKGFSLVSTNFDLTQENNHRTLCFSPKSTLKGIPSMPVFYNEIEDSPLLNSHLYLSDAGSLRHYIDRLLKETVDNSRYSREICSCILKELLTELHRYQPAAPSVVDTVIKYINTNYSQNLNNKELATMTGYHEYHLNRLFLAHTGTSMHNYLLRVRLNHAKHWILNTDIPLNEIPEKVGFNSYSHFSSYFKQYYGVSPAEYRKHMKNLI